MADTPLKGNSSIKVHIGPTLAVIGDWQLATPTKKTTTVIGQVEMKNDVDEPEFLCQFWSALEYRYMSSGEEREGGGGHRPV